MSLLSNLFEVSPVAPRLWCRPTHRLNCTYVIGGNSCCVCVPATATCFIIEIWGQGGGGAGSCCCTSACTGGQGGDYGWVACTTSGTVHTLCACACTCNCCTPGMGAFSGSPGQLSAVTDCSVANCYKAAASACGGSTQCNGGALPMNAPGCDQMVFNAAHSNLSIQCCCYGAWTSNWYGGAASACCVEFAVQNPFSPMKNMPFQQVQGTSKSGVTCSCCICFNFYVRGGCGWSNPHELTAYYPAILCWYNNPMNTYCGAGAGRGGSAYAGGMGQLCDCQMGFPQFGGVNGNAPGGGGSSASGTGCSGGCCLGSCGGLGMILISWS